MNLLKQYQAGKKLPSEVYFCFGWSLVIRFFRTGGRFRFHVTGYRHDDFAPRAFLAAGAFPPQAEIDRFAAIAFVEGQFERRMGIFFNVKHLKLSTFSSKEGLRMCESLMYSPFLWTNAIVGLYVYFGNSVSPIILKFSSSIITENFM
jgi:hypothetical protein